MIRPNGSRLGRKSLIPDVISAAEGLAVADEAGAVLVQEDPALDALEAGGVPLEVRRHPENVLVLDGRPAADAQAAAGRRVADAADAAVTGDGTDGTRDDRTGTDGHRCSAHTHGRHRRVLLLQRVVV